jgi:hypothetical protein
MEGRHVKDLRRTLRSAKSFHAQFTVNSANGLNGLNVMRSVALVCRSVTAMRQLRNCTVVSFAVDPLSRIRSARSKIAPLTAKFPIGRKRRHATRNVVVVRDVRSVPSRSMQHTAVTVALLTLSGTCHATLSPAQLIV